MSDLERPLSEEECKNLGGHYWNYHGANDVVNEFGEYQGTRTLMYYPDGESQLRTCGICGKREKKVERWEGVE